MAVIYRKMLRSTTRFSRTTDSASATLRRDHFIVLLGGNSILLLELTTAFNCVYMLRVYLTPPAVIVNSTSPACRRPMVRASATEAGKHLYGFMVLTDRTAARFHHYASKIGINSG